MTHGAKAAIPGKDDLQRIISLHRRGAGGLRVSLLLTTRLDRLIQKIYEDLDYPPKGHVALVALGGYGRKELCFGSDTDILFLVPDDKTKPEASFGVQKLLYGLLDLGLDVGHSVRTVEECLALRKGDVESWVSILESRFICGNQTRFRQLRTSLVNEIASGEPGVLVGEILARLETRHRKYGDSSKLLEPNVKNSAGGLRDLHTALWLMLGTASLKLPGTLKPKETALTTLLRSPSIRKASDQRSLLDSLKALDVILRTRNEMHLQGKGLHDTLEFTFQQQVATALGYKNKKARSSVEQFMQNYYLSARRISGLTRRIVGTMQQRYLRSPDRETARKVDQSFAVKGGRLFLEQGNALTNTTLLLGILHSLRQGASFSFEFEDAIGRKLHRFKPLRSPKETALFREILLQPSGVADIFKRLNDYDVLSRWIPEWKGMVAFFQHNQYHYYTSDEHTLRVIANAEGLGEGDHALSQVFRNLPGRETLYLACLLHDITKPRRIGGHEITGARMADRILKRLRCSDLSRDVSFLIRHHLTMEQVAFRRNLSDPQTIVDFASKFHSGTQLDYLYVLTYADLSAVNKNVWTDWKGMLLHELYQKAREVLDRNLSSEDVHLAARSHHQAAVRQLVDTLAEAVPQESSLTHLEAIDSPAYLATFDSNEIADHIRRIGNNESVSATFRHRSKYTEITVIAHDAPSQLSKFCGVLSANDANILDAQIFTRSDGIIIDKFRVMDFVSQSFLSEGQCAKILQELNDVLAGSLAIDDLLQRHRMKWRRRTRAPGTNVRFDVLFEEHPRFTIIDLFGADMLGFLYKVTETMARLGLNIYFAKIATRADGIVDSFYVLDLDGKRIDSGDRQSAVKAELLATMNDLSQSELILT